MPRFYFHIDGAKPHRDLIGEDLPNDAAAWRMAMRFASDIESNLSPGQFWHLEVRDGEAPVYLVEIKTFLRR